MDQILCLNAEPSHKDLRPEHADMRSAVYKDADASPTSLNHNNLTLSSLPHTSQTPDLPTTFMTVQVVPINNKEKLMHPSHQQDKSNKSMHNSRQQDYFRRLDRVLAARYVQECMLRRNRRQPTPATNPDTPQVWQPRYVYSSFL